MMLQTANLQKDFYRRGCLFLFGRLYMQSHLGENIDNVSGYEYHAYRVILRYRKNGKEGLNEV